MPVVQMNLEYKPKRDDNLGWTVVVVFSLSLTGFFAK